MRVRKLFLSAAVLLVIGVGSLWSKWDGNAGITAGYPTSQWVVSFNGSVHGWPAMIGVVALLAGIVTFLIGLIRTLIE
jgi:hypothetical protein